MIDIANTSNRSHLTSHTFVTCCFHRHCYQMQQFSGWLFQLPQKKKSSFSICKSPGKCTFSMPNCMNFKPWICKSWKEVWAIKAFYNLLFCLEYGCTTERLHTVMYPATVLLSKNCWLLWLPSQSIFEKVLNYYQTLYTLASCTKLKYYKRVKYSCFNSFITKSISI